MYRIKEILGLRGKDQTTSPNDWPIAVHITMLSPGCCLKPELLLQENLGRVGAIIRHGSVPEGKYKERYLDYYANALGKVIIGALEREAIWTMERHVSTFEKTNRWVGLFVGNGNLGANNGFICYLCRDNTNQRGLFCPPSFKLREDPYPSIVVWKNGRTAIEYLRYELGTNTSEGWWLEARVFRVDRVNWSTCAEVTDQILWATSGQHIVQAGNGISYDDLLEMVLKGWFYDLNHVFLFPWLKVKDIYEKEQKIVFAQVGRRWLLDSSGNPDPNKIRPAMTGETVEIPLDETLWQGEFGYPSDGFSSFVSDLSVSLRKSFYNDTGEVYPTNLGEYCFRGDSANKKLLIQFLPGIYPHNLFGITKEGRIVLLQVSFPNGGKMVGNRSSLTIVGTAKVAVAAANRVLAVDHDQLADCLMLDNGGDVMLWARTPNGDWERRVESELQREAIRSIIAFVANEPVLLPKTSVWYVDALLQGSQWKNLHIEQSASALI